MRSRTRQKQKVWYSKVTEEQQGIDTIQIYDKPTMIKAVVSATAGTSDEIGAGLVPDYDRVITTYKPLPVEEGYAFWIDKVPQLDDEGNLVMEEPKEDKGDSQEPIMPPDYTLKRILATQKGTVFRYGISKIGGNR